MTIASDLTAPAVDLARERVMAERNREEALADRLALMVQRAQDCAERAALIEEGVVPRHWLAQLGEAAAGVVPGVVSLAARKAARTTETRL